MDFDLFFAQQAPTRVGIIALSIIPTAIGLSLFAYMRRADVSSAAFRMRWLSVVPILVGIGLGIQKVAQVNDFLYRAYHLIGQKMIIMHYAVLVVPILGVIALGIWGWRSTKEEKYDF